MAASATDAEVPIVPDLRVFYARSERPEVSYELAGGPTLEIAIERHGQHWLVIDRVTGIHGSGDEPSEALVDFRRALSEHLDLLERQDALSDDLVQQLHYLRARARQI